MTTPAAAGPPATAPPPDSYARRAARDGSAPAPRRRAPTPAGGPARVSFLPRECRYATEFGGNRDGLCGDNMTDLSPRRRISNSIRRILRINNIVAGDLPQRDTARSRSPRRTF